MIKLLVATRNRHKVAEIQSLLGSVADCWGLDRLPSAPVVIEDASDFSGNARKKAGELASWLERRGETGEGTGVRYVLADDSGLEVDALGGAPGVHSARFATLGSGHIGNASDADNNAKLLEMLQGVPAGKRTARFRCALAVIDLSRRQQDCMVCEGVCEGRIDFAPRGRGGFGYDPLFIPADFEVSFAELGEAVKNQISHRAVALSKLKTLLVGQSDSVKP